MTFALVMNQKRENSLEGAGLKENLIQGPGKHGFQITTTQNMEPQMGWALIASTLYLAELVWSDEEN